MITKTTKWIECLSAEKQQLQDFALSFFSYLPLQLHETLGNTNKHKEQDRNSKAPSYHIYVMKRKALNSMCLYYTFV